MSYILRGDSPLARKLTKQQLAQQQLKNSEHSPSGGGPNSVRSFMIGANDSASQVAA